MPSLTLNFSAANAVRIRAAIENTEQPLDDEGQPRAATVADAKDVLIRKLTRYVRSAEIQIAARASADAATDVDIT